MSEAFDLPLGIVTEGGLVKSFTVKPMTAGTRRKALNRDSMRNPTKAVTNILLDCCEMVADKVPTERLLDSMTLGDRDYMLYEIRKLSLGNIIHATVSCPRCQSTNQIDINMDDVPIKRLVDGEGYVLLNTVPVFAAKNDELGIEVKCKFPTANDQKPIVAKMQVDPLGANYDMYARLLLSWVKNGTQIPPPYSQAFVDALAVPEIEWFEQAFADAQPGPDWDARVHCHSCERPTILDMSESDFLFKTPA